MFTKTFAKATISWNVNQIVKGYENGSIVFDNAIQRNEVWNINQMSLLIDSVIRGLPIPQIYSIKTNDKVKTKKGEVSVYSCIDGKQRCTALIKFLHNEFALQGLAPFDFGGEEIDLNGKTFDDLAEYDLQDDIKSYTLSFAYFSDISDEDVAEMMSRLNNGKPMTGVENARIKAKTLNRIIELAKHPFLAEILSEKAINGYANEDIIMKSLLLMNGDPDLSSKNVRVAYESYDLNNERYKEQGEKLWNILTLVGKAVEDLTELANEKVIKRRVIKKITGKANLISIIYGVSQFKENSIEPDDLAEALKEFFGSDGNDVSIDQIYNDACTNGTMRSSNVEARNSAITEFFCNSFGTDNMNEE